MAQKEYGSEFFFPTHFNQNSLQDAEEDNRLYASGRDAFAAILGHGQTCRSWKRLFIPSYFCQEVVKTFISSGINVITYEDSPLTEFNPQAINDVCAGDVILALNYFGLRGKFDWSKVQSRGAEIIEDHTHDPWSAWSIESNANWCLASFRKTLPIPDGAILWSPNNHPLPPIVSSTDRRENASLRKMAGMVFKGLYLREEWLDKSLFRNLLLIGEQDIATGEISGITAWSRRLLQNFPIAKWRKIRSHNWSAFLEQFPSNEYAKILKPFSSNECCPFSIFLVFENASICTAIKDKLIANKIYPAILWSLKNPAIDGIPPEHIQLSQRVMSLHCDMRYNRSDMAYICSYLVELLQKLNS